MKKIKQFIESEQGKDVLIILIVILVGIISFYLGRLSKNSDSGLKIEYSNQKANVLSAFETGVENTPKIEDRIETGGSGKYFASKNGKRYYPIGCSAGKTIKQENRIYFQTPMEAEEAGFSISASCK